MTRHVVATIPGLGRTPAAFDEERATLTLYVLPLRPLAEALGENVVVEYVTPRGVARVEGAIAAVPEREVVELALGGAPSIVQRREHVRAEVMLAVTVEGAAAAAPSVDTHTLDLSGAGMLVGGLPGVSVGDRVTVRLDEPPLHAAATVVRDCGDGRRGLRFEGLSPAEEDRIVHFVFERERLERRRMGRPA